MSRVYALALTGERFGRWIVLNKREMKGPHGEIFWHCRCDCGSTRDVQAKGLRSGESTSCGCYHREAVTIHGMTKSRTWKSWDSMLQRCENPNAPDYAKYGGRGIKIVPEWHEFEKFFAAMGERPADTTLERNEVDGDYSPDNCRWASASEQQRNKRNAIRITLKGVTKNVHDWAADLGVSVTTLKSRIEKGWSAELTLTTPVRPKRPVKGK